MHVCCSGRPLPVLGGISSGCNTGKKRCPLQTPRRRNPRHPPCIPGIQRDFSFWTWANYLLRVLILVVHLWILAQELTVANGGGGKGKWRKSCVCDSKQGGSKAVLTFSLQLISVLWIKWITVSKDDISSKLPKYIVSTVTKIPTPAPSPSLPHPLFLLQPSLLPLLVYVWHKCHQAWCSSHSAFVSLLLHGLHCPRSQQLLTYCRAIWERLDPTLSGKTAKN